MSHPSLGLPGPDLSAGFPQAAERVRDARERLGVRGLEAALHSDPTMRERLGDDALRHLLRDTEVMLERIALCVAADDPAPLREWADWVGPVYRRRRVPLDDVVTLGEGLRVAVASVLSPEERVPADRAIDEAAKVFRWHRRLAGDARKRNRILTAIYKGG